MVDMFFFSQKMGVNEHDADEFTIAPSIWSYVQNRQGDKLAPEYVQTEWPHVKLQYSIQYSRVE
jgi:hypothetical protein